MKITLSVIVLVCLVLSFCHTAESVEEWSQNKAEKLQKAIESGDGTAIYQSLVDIVNEGLAIGVSADDLKQGIHNHERQKGSSEKMSYDEYQKLKQYVTKLDLDKDGKASVGEVLQTAKDGLKYMLGLGEYPEALKETLVETRESNSWSSWYDKAKFHLSNKISDVKAGVSEVVKKGKAYVHEVTKQ